LVRSRLNSPGTETEAKVEALRRDFVSSIKGVPEEFLEELFLIFFDKEIVSADELAERANLLPDLVDLIHEDLDDRRDPFRKEDWHQIGELVSEFGTELDESLLTYIMGKVVERRAL